MTERKVLKTNKPRARLTLPPEPVRRKRAVLHVEPQPPVLQRAEALLAQRSPRARKVLRLPLPANALAGRLAPPAAKVAAPVAENLPVLIDRGCFLKERVLRNFGPGNWTLTEDRKKREIIGKSADGARYLITKRYEHPEGVEHFTAILSHLPKNAMVSRYFDGKKEAPYVHERANAWLCYHLLHEPKF